MSWEFRYMSFKLSKFSWGLSHKYKYKFAVKSKIEFRPSAPSACNTNKMFSRLLVDVLVHNSTEYQVCKFNVKCCTYLTNIDRKKCRKQLWQLQLQLCAMALLYSCVHTAVDLRHLSMYCDVCEVEHLHPMFYTVCCNTPVFLGCRWSYGVYGPAAIWSNPDPGSCTKACGGKRTQLWTIRAQGMELLLWPNLYGKYNCRYGKMPGKWNGQHIQLCATHTVVCTQM
jgi:hypothetical protein